MRSIDRLRARADIVLVVRGVYRVVGSPQTWDQKVMAAWLGSTGPLYIPIVAHATAAALYDFHEFCRSGKPHLVTNRGASARSRIAIIATCTDLRPHDISKFPSGTLVTSKTRTVLDIALIQKSEARLSRFLDRCLLDRHSTIPKLWELLTHVEASGKRGVVQLREALLARSDDYVPLESELEHLAFEALAAAGGPVPQKQHPLPGPSVGKVDLAFPMARLIVELDGRQHQTTSARRVDYERDISAARAGWQVLRFDWFQVKFSPNWFAESVGEVRRAREQMLRAA
jgi:hypothetical protein